MQSFGIISNFTLVTHPNWSIFMLTLGQAMLCIWICIISYDLLTSALKWLRLKTSLSISLSSRIKTRDWVFRNIGYWSSSQAKQAAGPRLKLSYFGLRAGFLTLLQDESVCGPDSSVTVLAEPLIGETQPCAFAEHLCNVIRRNSHSQASSRKAALWVISSNDFLLRCIHHHEPVITRCSDTCYRSCERPATLF